MYSNGLCFCYLGTSVNNERMTVALEELQDLRGVWSSLSKIWTQIDDIREKPWLSVQPRKLRYYILHISDSYSLIG